MYILENGMPSKVVRPLWSLPSAPTLDPFLHNSYVEYIQT